MRFACFFAAVLAIADTAPMADENLRMAALRAVFPGMEISPEPGKRIDDSRLLKRGPSELDSPDALAAANVYRVIGKVTNEAEKEAADQLITGQPSSTRLVRFQIFRWPDGSGLLAVLQYKFEDASPSMACPSIGLLVQLANVDGTWTVRDQYLLETMHHFSLQAIRMLDLGAGVDELIIESDSGGAGTWDSNFLIFDLRQPKFHEIFRTTSRLSRWTDDMYKEVLDVSKTVRRRGERFCFTKTTMIEAEETFRPPRITRPCYRPDEGDNNEMESDERNKMLAPLLKP